MPESRKAGKPECRNAGNQDPEILKPGMTFREAKKAKELNKEQFRELLSL